MLQEGQEVSGRHRNGLKASPRHSRIFVCYSAFMVDGRLIDPHQDKLVYPNKCNSRTPMAISASGSLHFNYHISLPIE